MPKGNPHPKKPERWDEFQKPKHAEELASKPIATRYPVDVDAFLRSLPDRAEFVRAAVRRAMEMEEAGGG